MKIKLVGKRVKVYRNLKYGKDARPLYSIIYDGRVVSRRHRVLLSNVVFKVNENGRKRVLRERRKNVHAFAIGTLVGKRGCMGQDCNGKDFGIRVHYNPYGYGKFMCMSTSPPIPLKGAWAVLLNERGISACYTERDNKDGMREVH